MGNLVANKVNLNEWMKSNEMRFQSAFQFTQILDYSFSCSSDFYFPVHHHFIETKHNKLVLNSQSIIYVAVHSYACPESSHICSRKFVQSTGFKGRQPFPVSQYDQNLYHLAILTQNPWNIFTNRRTMQKKTAYICHDQSYHND